MPEPLPAPLPAPSPATAYREEPEASSSDARSSVSLLLYMGSPFRKKTHTKKHDFHH